MSARCRHRDTGDEGLRNVIDADEGTDKGRNCHCEQHPDERFPRSRSSWPSPPKWHDRGGSRRVPRSGIVSRPAAEVDFDALQAETDVERRVDARNPDVLFTIRTKIDTRKVERTRGVISLYTFNHLPSANFEACSATLHAGSDRVACSSQTWERL